jgi:hypothetical protein
MGTTATQAILSYTAPTQDACTVEVSESAGYDPPVHDADARLYPGAERDDRPGNIVAGRARTFVAGARKTQRAATGANYSRALQANTPHFFRITCGGDVASGTFTTANIPLGSTRIESLETDPASPGKYLQPSSNVLYNPTIVDPQTGLLLKNVNTLGWAYAGTTGAAGVSFTAVENPSLRWSNPGGALEQDGATASYSGNTRDWLWLRYPAYPDSSTFTNNVLSFQNIHLNGYCSGPDCGTGGEVLEACITRTGLDEGGAHCDGPVRELQLPTTATTIVLCEDGAPCRTPGRPGDTLTYDSVPATAWAAGTGYVYNTKDDYRQLYFTNPADCRRLRQNDSIRIYASNSSTDFQPRITNMGCAASPPRATMSAGAALDYNGTSGVPFHYASGARQNPRYGVLIRKKSTTARSTIFLDRVWWRAASASQVNFGWGSGGFNRVCTKKPDANGFYHCQAGNSMVTGIRTEPNGDLTVRFLGVAYFLGQTVPGVVPGFQFCGGGLGDWLWDDDDPNAMYCMAASTYPNPATGKADGRTVLLKAVYTGNDIECGQPGSKCPAANQNGGEFERWPRLPLDLTVLTPCLGGCTSTDQDFTPSSQLKKFTAEKTIPWDEKAFPYCGIEAVQGKTLVLACRAGQQDSFAWLWVMDLGNGLPIGAGYAGSRGNALQVIAANPLFARKPSRWCTLHTYQNIREAGIATPEMQVEHDNPFTVTLASALAQCSKGQGDCSPCPNITMDGFEYSGKNWCSTIDVTSEWKWGEAPRGYRSGEPVSNAAALHFLGTAQPGDIVTAGGEYMKILVKASPTQWIVERGFGRDQTYLYPRAHAGGSTLTMFCSNDLDPATSLNIFAGTHWFYLQDPDGTGAGSTYQATDFVNHAFGRNGIRVRPEYLVSLAPFQASEMLNPSYSSSIELPGVFAGRTSMASGNTIEKHPSYGQEDAAPQDQKWFLDAHPYLFMGNAGSAHYAATHIDGDLYEYHPAAPLSPKHFDVAAFSGQYPLSDVSGTDALLTGAPADAYKFCTAWRAGDCVAGSQPGAVYFNVPALDRTVGWCKEGEFYSGWRDICIGNFNVLGAGYAQWGLPATAGERLRHFESGRLLSRMFEPYRGPATANAKPTPDGKWMLFRSNLIGKLPPFPAKDGADRSNFITMKVTAKPPEGLGVDNAVVEFGYDGPGDRVRIRRNAGRHALTTTAGLRCTARGERCVSATRGDSGAGFDTANPFWYADSDLADNGGLWNGAGVPCASGCTVAIPAISQRVLYYRWKFRNASNVEVGQSEAQAVAVP